ncbi:MAG: thermonuclease family protein [Parvibaculales bacterium]
MDRNKFIIQPLIVCAALLGFTLSFVTALDAKTRQKQILPGPFQFDVLDVYDGDTFTARIDIWLGQTVTVKIRLTEIDTPEMRGKCAFETQLAQQARQFSKNWLQQEGLVLTNVHYGTYAGRVLATAQTKKGETLSSALLNANLAKPYLGRRAQWCN